MTKIDSLLLLSLGELLLVTTLVSILMIALAVVRKRRDRCAAQRLVEHIKEGEGKRRAETENIAQHQYGLEGSARELLVSRINREEKVFYQRLINLYLKRDASTLATLHLAFEGATEPYRSLEIKPATGHAEDNDHAAELARLQEQNEHLSTELTITMDTLGRMLSEYSSMYAGGTGDELDKEKMLEMFRTEAIAQAAEAAAKAEEPAPVEPEEEVMISAGNSIAADDRVKFGSNQALAEKSAEGQATEAAVKTAAGTLESGLAAELPPAVEDNEVTEQRTEGGAQIESGIDLDALDELMSLDDDMGSGLESYAPEEDALDAEDAGRPLEKKLESGH